MLDADGLNTGTISMNFGQLVSNAVALAMGFAAGLLVSLWADNASVDVQHLREVEAQLVEARRAVRDRDALLSASGIKASDEAVGYRKSQALIGLLLHPEHAERVSRALRDRQAALGDWYRPIDMYANMGHEWLADEMGVDPDELKK